MKLFRVLLAALYVVSLEGSTLFDWKSKLFSRSSAGQEVEGEFEDQNGRYRYQAGEQLISSVKPVKVFVRDKKIVSIYQSHPYDSSAQLQYWVKPDKQSDLDLKFPQDFLLEVPRSWMRPNPAKRFDQIAFLGSHNCFTNLAEGYLYYQQGESTLKQFNHGVRMFRTAWHNPSGARIDSPNKEPILCHSDDELCGSVSLATRGFRPHEIVVNQNMLFKEQFDKNPNDVFIIGVNNYLPKELVDVEIEKIPGFAQMCVTPDDLLDGHNHKIWNGFWPTVEWMLHHNKRIIIFNDFSTKYTLGYNDFIKRNAYGTTNISQGAEARTTFTGSAQKALIELSWFQDISLEPRFVVAVDSGVSFYLSMRSKVEYLYNMGGRFARYVIGFFERVGLPVNYFAQTMSFFVLQTGIEIIVDKLGFIMKFSIFESMGEKIKSQRAALHQAINAIQTYKPEPQDNSLNTLLELMVACRKSGIILPSQIANIIMLDFATTEGDGIICVNLLNMLMDQYLKIGFLDIGGFALGGNEVVIPAGLLPEN